MLLRKLVQFNNKEYDVTIDTKNDDITIKDKSNNTTHSKTSISEVEDYKEYAINTILEYEQENIKYPSIKEFGEWDGKVRL